jgi:hypothetical protein
MGHCPSFRKISLNVWREGVRNVDGLSIQDRSASRYTSNDRPAFLDPWTRDRPVLGSESNSVTIDAPNLCIDSVAEPRRTFRDRVQYRLNIRR